MNRRGGFAKESAEKVWAERNGHHAGIPVVSADAVETKDVEWLWYRRIPLGKLTIFDGDPDQGKSVVTMDIAARVSTGRGFPDKAGCEAANVAVVNVEDDVADTIVPRLKAAGADLSRIRILSSIPDGKGSTRLLEIPHDVAELERVVVDHDIKLLILDPVLTMLGGDANKDQDARKALTPLKDMAERTGCAIVAIRHLNKSVGLKAIQRGGGNMGLIGVARAGSFFAENPDAEGQKVMVPHKSNLSEKAPGLTYRIVTAAVHNTARIEWMGVTEHDANSLASNAQTPHEKSELDEAKDFLRDELADGPMWAKQVFKDARDAGVAEKTLYRAKTALRVKSVKCGTEGWSWELPDEKVAKDGQSGDVGHGDHVGHVGHVQAESEATPLNVAYLREDGQDGQDGHVQDQQPTVGAAEDALRYGNGPRKVLDNIYEGTQGLQDLARSVMRYYGAKQLEGWESWLEPVAETFDQLTSEDDVPEGGVA